MHEQTCNYSGVRRIFLIFIEQNKLLFNENSEGWVLEDSS